MVESPTKNKPSMPGIWWGIFDFHTIPGSLTTDSTNFQAMGLSHSKEELKSGYIDEISSFIDCTICFIFWESSATDGATGVPAIIKCSPGGEPEGVMFEMKNIPFVV